MRQFWHTRERQAADQFRRGSSDQGARSAVTGGQHMNGFAARIIDVLVARGVQRQDVFYKVDRTETWATAVNSKTELPGYFRTSKSWDMLVLTDGKLRAIIELKSQVGSFGNNFNNRVEEALGSATDFWTAYREGQFGTSPRPWLGYIFLLADTAASRRAGSRIATPHFPARSEFQSASYARRLEFFCRRLVLERLYGSACLILADPERAGADVNYSEPAEDLAADQFLVDLVRHAIP
ncbi:MAG: restriction endonuclease [Chloroflexota bacterium]|nr:MAG: restriction endonuclease [Chloroflexota bacterium]